MAYNLLGENSTLDWLKEKEGSLLETAEILYFAFGDQERLDSVSVSPGVILDASTGSINFFNRGENPVQVELSSPEFISLDLESFLLTDKKKVNVVISERKDGAIEFSYGNRSNKILVVSSGAVGGSKSEGIILERVGTNLQTEGLTLNSGKSSRGVIRIKNAGSVDAPALEVAIQGNIADIIKVEEKAFDLKSDEEKNIVLVINENLDARGEYSGELVIRSENEKFLEIPLGVTFIGPNQETSQENESRKGIFEEPKKREDNKEPKEEKSGAWKRWVIIGIILILGLAIFWALRKKKKKQPAVSDDERRILDVVKRYNKE